MGELILAEKLGDKDLRTLSAIYADMWGPVLAHEFPRWDREQIIDDVFCQFRSRIERFSEGQLAWWDSQEGVQGGVSALMVSAQDAYGEVDFSRVPSEWNELTSKGYFEDHDPDGNLLVCCAINVPPIFGGRGIPRQLLHGETQLATERGLIACAYTRPIGLREYLEREMKFRQGFDHMVIETEILDAYLRAHLQRRQGKGRFCDKNVGLHSNYGAEVKRILPRARVSDADSCGYCILMAYPKGHVISVDRN